MNFKRKLQLLLISLISIPWNIFAYSKYLIPGGENIGINVEASGVYVVGFYKVSGDNIAEDAGIKIGDRIIRINNQEIKSVNDLMHNINVDTNEVILNIGFIRDNVFKSINMNLKKDQDGSYKTGIYVKDALTGIGTLTFIDPVSNYYGALGHEIVETNSGNSFVIRTGDIYKTSVESIKKSISGEPGEKRAIINYEAKIGNILLNNETGIYGLYHNVKTSEEVLPVGELDEIKIGKAEIITVVENNTKERYEIEILSIMKDSKTKNFMFKITDECLLQKTGGVVKGMSGSPIIQDGKIIGAVTHAIVDSPNKGFGISIIKMLESIE